jgi:hypothetical protein
MLKQFIDSKQKEFDDVGLDHDGWGSTVKDFISQTILDTAEYVKKETMLEEKEQEFEYMTGYEVGYGQAVSDQQAKFKEME